jgi:spermidine/putrescine transport system substrate-binding protein
MRIIIGFMLLVLPLVAIAQEDVTWECPEGYQGETLRILNWSTYIAEDTIPNFEEACDVTIEYAEAGSAEEMREIVLAEEEVYDIIVPSTNVAELMISEGLLYPLDLDMIPNVDNLGSQFINLLLDPGNEYTIPYQWGTIGIGYDTNAVTEPVTSWEDMWNHEGTVAWLNDPRAMIGIAQILLGYDVNTFETDEIIEAQELLLDNMDNVITIADDDGQDMLAAGEADMVIEYSGDIFQLMDECECEDYAYVIPEEGSIIWMDNMAIPFNAQNPELAMVFMNYILDPQVGADLSNYTAYGTPNDAARDYIDEELISNPAIYPTEAVQNSLSFVVEVPEASAIYESLWQDITFFLDN